MSGLINIAIKRYDNMMYVKGIRAKSKFCMEQADPEMRPPMFRYIQHPSRFWRERICPMYFCFYVLPFGCPPPSLDFGDERVKSMCNRSVVLPRSVTLIAWTPCVCIVIVGLQMSLSHCPNTGSMHLAFKGLVSGYLANKTLQSHVHKMSIGLMLGHCLWHCTVQQRTNHSFYITLLGGRTMTR